MADTALAQRQEMMGSISLILGPMFSGKTTGA
jgi:hypothetical protein